MNFMVISIGVIVVLIIVSIIYRSIAFRKESIRNSKLKFERIESLYEKLEKGETPTYEEIQKHSSDIKTREMTFQLLVEHNKTELFPKEYYSIQKAAESNLANWLEFPTELDACPDEIEHVKRVTIDFDGQNNFVHYEVFKYRVNEPHWAAKNGWILGVVGPYFDDSKPYDHPHATFSRVGSKLETTNPDDEVHWVHKNISMRK